MRPLCKPFRRKRCVFVDFLTLGGPIMAHSKLRTRSKKRFKTSRAAWRSIAKATGKRASDVLGTDHTSKSWRYHVK